MESTNSPNQVPQSSTNMPQQMRHSHTVPEMALNMSDSALSISTSSAASGEIIYSSGRSSSGVGSSLPTSTSGSSEHRSMTAHGGHAMSTKVQQMAATIYKEFEKIIAQYDENAVKELMPLVVTLLDSLDMAVLEKEEREVELELLREDNEQLAIQYEREKQLRRATEQHSLEMVDHFEEKQKEMESKTEGYEVIIRKHELKSKNIMDSVARSEEREHELRLENSKVHEKYNDLLQKHMDYMERMKYITGNDSPESIYHSVRRKTTKSSDYSDADATPEPDAMENSSSTVKETDSLDVSAYQEWHADLSPGGGLDPFDDHSLAALQRASSISERSDVSNGSRDTAATDFTSNNANVLGADFIGMGKEIESLIHENSELLETKNALNVVKNDLIARVDELTSEQIIFKEEVRSLELVKQKLEDKNHEIENDLKKCKEEVAKLQQTLDEENVPMSQRKRFTRAEMVRVLTERNQYKEKLMELQDAIRWKEMVRASKETGANPGDMKRKQRSIWDL